MIYTQIAALIPFYDDYGQNSTRILLKDGSVETANCSIKNYIYRMLYALHLDPKAVRFWTTQMIGSKINAPLVIDDTLVLLPVKFRKGVGKQDGCFGYINNQFISEFQNNEVILASGISLPTLSPKSYILKKQNDAKLLSYSYVDYKKQYEFMWKN